MKKVLLLFYIGYLNIYKINNFFFSIILEINIFLIFICLFLLLLLNLLNFIATNLKIKNPKISILKEIQFSKKMKTFKINIPPPKKQIKTIAFLIKKNSKSLSKSQQKF